MQIRFAWAALVFVCACVGELGCGDDTGSDPNADGGSDANADGGGIAYEDLCTVWSDFSTTKMVCIDDEGTWAEVAEVCPAGGCGCGETHLSRTTSGDLLAAHDSCGGTEDEAILVKRYTEGAGWELAATRPVNTDAVGDLMPTYSQFGASVVGFGSDLLAFWTSTSTSYSSRLVGDVWEHTPMVEGELVRHTETYTDGERVFFHHGMPKPMAWEITSGVPVSLGEVPVAETEYTLYTSATLWQGNLVLAYTTQEADTSWPETTDEVRVAFHDGDSTWTIDTSPIQDTPGHDGVTPFLFVRDGDLHILYADYTTSGLPTSSQSVYFRFRVKRWTGSAWERVGGESAVVLLSQRFEYLHTEEAVYVGAMHVRQAGGGTEQIVLGWSGDEFYQTGESVAVFTSGTLWRARPGAVVQRN
jgi:hypothetical protein